jgi:serine/threonine-protein kinase
MPAPPGTDLLALQNALAGEYAIDKELGRGGMGIVYLARDVELDRNVAIKVLPPEFSVRPELRERFLREARTSAKLSHPNIVPVHRADDVGGFVFFVMAYVDGETLGQRVRGRGPLTPAQAARTFREVAWALAYAHARGVIHRDVKPDNILLERDTGRALVTDFGIALRSDAGALTDEGNVMGTAQFMSPEQAAGEVLDGRSDLYSLGVVGYFALTGNLPFDGPTVQSILAKHLTKPHPPLIGRPGIPDALAKAVDKCLGKTPADRWLTGEALADAIGDATPAAQTIPAPIRVWLTKGGWMGPLGAVWYVFWMLDLFDGAFLNWPTFFAGILPVGLYALVNGALARRALDAGFGYEDLIAGLRQELEAQREERRFDVGREPPLAFKIIRWITYAAWASIAGTLGYLVLNASPLTGLQLLEKYGAQMAWVVLTALAGSVFGMMYPGRRLSDRNWFGALRWKFWHGPLGRALVRVAGMGGNARTRATSVHRPTEIAIGLAAEDLYDALPRELQHRFKELPRVVRHLEDEAQAIRGRMTVLANTASTVASPAPGNAGEGERLLADLTVAREREQQRLTSALAALEAIRLDLLRLSAGVGDPESLTRAIAAATRLGDDVDALVGRVVPQAGGG